MRKEEGQMGKLGRSREGCRQGWTYAVMLLPSPPPTRGAEPPYCTFGGCLWLPPDCLGRGLTAGRKREMAKGTFLPVGL